MIRSKKLEIQFTEIPFTTISQKDRAAQMGLVILETDLTIETEFRKYLSQDETVTPRLSLLNTRIPCDDKVTEQNLTLMENHFSNSLALFPKNYEFDVIGYGCTSASLLLGEEKINKLVKSNVKTDYVTTPMSAVKKALAALDASKIGFVAPYISDIAHKMASNLIDAGFNIIKGVTFCENRDSVVGIISPSSILRAIESVRLDAPNIEAIFVACTSLKCEPIIPIAEESYGLPIVSSNSALAWDMVHLANANIIKSKKGKLFTI